MSGLRPFASAGATLTLWLGAFAGSRSEETAEVRAVLQRRPPGESRHSTELVAGLAALGADAVPVLYGLVTGQGLDAFIGGAWKPEAWSCKPEEIPELCALALARAPTKAVVEELTRALERGPAFQERLVILRVLGSQGAAAGLELAWRNASELGAVELGRPSVRLALREALVAILRTDERAWRVVEQQLTRLEPAVCEVLVEALGESGRGRGMDVLERLFDERRCAPELVATSMARLEGKRPWELEGRTLARCGPWLESQDLVERARATRLVGDLHALALVPALIELAADDEPLVKRCAADALRRMAGLPIASDREALESWFACEERWREAHLGRLLGLIATGPPGPAQEALRELARHPLYRHQVAHELSQSLGRQPRSVALSSCAELERLGSHWALPGLLALLEDSPPQLRAAAWHTLQALTGEQRELSLELWRALIG